MFLVATHGCVDQTGLVSAVLFALNNSLAKSSLFILFPLYSSPSLSAAAMGFHNHHYPRPLVPNTQDPSAVDFRAFYPYTPNEVKHRKRTTSQQLKVLETIFKKDTKPNAQLRQELAAELNMTARGVQVRPFSA